MVLSHLSLRMNLYECLCSSFRLRLHLVGLRLWLWQLRLWLCWWSGLSYGPPWAHYLGGYQDRLLGGPLGLPGLRYTAPEGVEHKDCRGEVLG
jgi:hypothetical protein